MASSRITAPLKFHWRLPQGGERGAASRAAMAGRKETGLPDLEAQIAFCEQAEECGIDSLLTAFGFYMPDPIPLATAAAMGTRKIKFMIAYRSGVISPVLFVQQLNTLSALTNGRFCLNIVAGHSPAEQAAYGDFLDHDKRYNRTDEFLAICNALWQDEGKVNFSGRHYQVKDAKLNTPFVCDERTAPHIFVGGNSDQARDLAIRQGSCWLRFPETPETLGPLLRPVLEAGKEVGLRLGLIARHDREDALRAAAELIAPPEVKGSETHTEKAFAQTSDSPSIQANRARAEQHDWLSHCLWIGAMRSHGPATASLVGTPQEIAAAMLEYKRVGISHFVLSGWPKLEEMIFFGREVLPRVRAMERAEDDGMTA